MGEGREEEPVATVQMAVASEEEALEFAMGPEERVALAAAGAAAAAATAAAVAAEARALRCRSTR